MHFVLNEKLTEKQSGAMVCWLWLPLLFNTCRIAQYVSICTIFTMHNALQFVHTFQCYALHMRSAQYVHFSPCTLYIHEVCWLWLPLGHSPLLSVQLNWHFDLLVLLLCVCRQWIVLTTVYCKQLFNTRWNSSTLFTIHIGGKVPLSVQNSHIDLLLLLGCVCYLTLVVLPCMPVHLGKSTGVALSSQLKPTASHLINQTVHYKIGFSFWKRRTSFGI